jgi:hypothetical protein
MNLSSFLQRLPAARVLRKTKDTLVAVGAKDRFNQMIRPYGKVLEFQLSTRERTVFASFRLKGELEAIQFWIHQYQLVADKKGQTFRARFSRNGGRGRHCGEQALPGNGSGANCVSVSGSCEVRVAALAFAKRNAQVKSAFALAALPNVAAIAAAVFFNTPALISVIMTTLGAVTYYRQASRVLRQASGGSAELPFLRKRSEADGASEPLLAPGFWLLAPSLDDRELVTDVQLWPPPWSPVLNA